ncbi:hypothetical protein [Photobacterium kishitanii]|uniref:Uncharacterized protein n=1 Tax=Photobacterium kishitanii TaxID=318456 RepID=A0A2T3KKY0_9GAMM|nr:hypothetical protein [Photobacterium kishitanii]PSV00351.1 hypothetical protein C9J27_04285 [Photobacterium kishitanii]
MTLSTQIHLLKQFAQMVFKQDPDSVNLHLFATKRDTDQAVDELTASREAEMFLTLEEVNNYLAEREKSYQAAIGVFIDFSSEIHDENGELTCCCEWVHVGFNHGCMDLVIDSETDASVISNYNENKLGDVVNELSNRFLKPSDGHMPFILKEQILLDPESSFGELTEASEGWSKSIDENETDFNASNGIVALNAYANRMFSSPDSEEATTIIKDLIADLRSVAGKLDVDFNSLL